MNQEILQEKLIQIQEKDFKGVSIEIQNLIIQAPQPDKTSKYIIKGISTKIEKESFTAIIGPSGSGKTTLLNHLASRTYKQDTFESYGTLLIDKVKVDSVRKISNIIGFVDQEEILEEDLTPRKIFEFYYTLRWNKGDKYKQRKEDYKNKINTLLKSLKLDHCQDTRIGSVYQSGLSGGEQKRVSIGAQLIQNPMVIFLDEPTTGLDSANAINIIQILKELSKQGVTIITSLHQPSTRILKQFDQILILCDGNLVFDGQPNQIKERLQVLELQPKENQPFLDYFVEIIDMDSVRIELMTNEETKKLSPDQIEEQVKQIYFDRIQKMNEIQRIETQKKLDQDQNKANGEYNLLKEISNEKNQQRFLIFQFFYLTMKFLMKQFLNLEKLFIKLFTILLLTSLFFLIFSDIPKIEDNPMSSYMTKGSVYFFLMNQIVFSSIAQGSTLILPQKKFFEKDSEGKLYNKMIFLTSTFVSNLPMIIFFQGIGATIYFWFLDINNQKFEYYLIYCLIYLVGGVLYGLSLGIFVGVLASSQKTANVILAIIGQPFFITAGFYAQTESISIVLKMIAKVNGLKYLLQAAILNEFRNRQEYIDNCNLPKEFQERCDPFSFYDFDYKDIWTNIYFLFITIAVQFLIAILMFNYKFRFREPKKITGNKFLHEITLQKIK